MFGLEDMAGRPYKCLTGGECSREGKCHDDDDNQRPCYYAYAATGTCIRNVPDETSGFTKTGPDKSVYDCGNRYLDISTFSCVEENACTGTTSDGYSMLLFRKK